MKRLTWHLLPPADSHHTMHAQFDDSGFTGNVLMCARDCKLLQSKVGRFEAFTLLMCAAAAGNKSASERLLDKGGAGYRAD